MKKTSMQANMNILLLKRYLYHSKIETCHITTLPNNLADLGPGSTEQSWRVDPDKCSGLQLPLNDLVLFQAWDVTTLVSV